MREELYRNLASKIDARIVSDILSAYEGLVQKHRAFDLEGALNRAGKFVEHIFRALEFIRAGQFLLEIRSPATTAQNLEKDTTLNEAIRLLIPRIAMSMIYNLRSKRGAVHVKEIDPRAIDVDLAVKAASWIVAELIRLYHVQDENAVHHEMIALTRATYPLMENIDGEEFVSKRVPPRIEIQLLLGKRGGEGATRKELGKMAKCDSRRVSDAIKELEQDRHAHLSAKGVYHLTGSGEDNLMRWLAENRMA